VQGIWPVDTFDLIMARTAVMRLTLRTLLAHLDNALEADDNASIAAKLRDSEFAASLVKRIVSCIASDRIGAASPIATSTADDANRIGEYLDSVLSSEQVAEIERICLESESHLAEVASCHQILTIVLGNPAEISPSLRGRIYELGQRRSDAGVSVAGTNGNPGGKVHRVASNTGAVHVDDALTRAMSASHAPPTNPTARTRTVQPVGPDDSGVSNAPTRLREVANAQSAAERAKPMGPGSRRMDAAEAAAVFGRPSRVVPWLVALALAASFLFVMSQAFKPLWRNAAVDDETMALATADRSDPMRAEVEDQIAVSPADLVPKEAVEIEATEAPPMVELDPSIGLPKNANSAAAVMPDSLPNEGSLEGTEMMELPVPVAEPIAAMESPVVVTPPRISPIEGNTTPDTVALMPADADATLTEAAPSIIETAVVSASVIATTITGEGTLTLIQKPGADSFVVGKKGDQVALASKVICPPLYRDRLSLFGKTDLTLIGPAKIVAGSADEAMPTLVLVSGRYLLSQLASSDAAPIVAAADAESTMTETSTLRIVFDGVNHELTFAESDAVVAIEIKPFRNPGTEPEAVRPTTNFIEVLSVQGALQWRTEGTDVMSISTGEVLRWSSSIAVAKSVSTSIPVWIDTPKPAPGSMENSARDGLLALVRPNEAIEMSLREAIDFRRAEVGALAAQTLILLDRPEVYFGADGILADVKQKASWPDHFSSLVAAIDHGPESAAIVREAINQMDSADAPAIYRLLWLFSNAQLEAGGDERLVASLDSPNMTVRVLAAENLRRITGTTLFYKPENDTAPRRSADINKWETRLRKDDIRWAAAGTPEAK